MATPPNQTDFALNDRHERHGEPEGTARMNVKSGMTVVELSILLAILALLAAISLPAFFQNQEKKRAAECAMNLDAIQNACRRQARDKGEFPKSLEALVPAYFESIPTCPSGGTYLLGSPEGDSPTCSVPGHHL